MTSPHSPFALALLSVTLLALGLLAPATARAQIPEGVRTILLLVVGNDGPPSVRRAEQAFQHELESRQLEVVLQREPVRRPGDLPVVDTCISGPCLERRIAEAHAQLFVGLGVWLDRPHPQISLTLDDGHGPVNVSERFEPGETDAHFARRLLDLGLHSFQGRHGVRVRIEGTPRGASVVIDHRPTGQLPLVTWMQPGPHDITVAHVDYTTARRHIELTIEGGDVVIELEPSATSVTTTTDAGAPASASVSVTPPAPSSRPIVGPVLLFAIAAAGIAGGAYGLTRSGCVERNSRGECLRQREAPTGGIALGFGGAALALAGAILWLSLGGREAAPGHVAVRVHPKGVDLRVNF